VAFIIVPIVLAAVVVAVAVAVRRDDGGRARLFRQLGLILMTVFAVLAAAFIGGETFDDPGGWPAVGLVAAWALPLAGLALLAWYRPTVGIRVLASLTAVQVVLLAGSLIAADAWRAFEDDVGPVRTLVSFVIAVPLGLLGWHRPVPAGALLVLLGAAPYALAAPTGQWPLAFASLSAVSTPSFVVGVLYLLSARFAARHAQHRPVTLGREAACRGEEERSGHHDQITHSTTGPQRPSADLIDEVRTTFRSIAARVTRVAVQSFRAADASTQMTPLLPSWSAITVRPGASLSSTTVPPAATAAAMRCSATSGAT
jgi:hypothetical protein